MILIYTKKICTLIKRWFEEIFAAICAKYDGWIPYKLVTLNLISRLNCHPFPSADLKIIHHRSKK